MKPSHHSLAEVLKRALPSRRRERIYSIELAALKWAEVVGGELAVRSEPVSLKDGILTIRVEEAPWGKVILKLQRQIIPRLNRAMGIKVVRRIVFVRDGQRVWKEKKPARPVAPVRSEAPPPSASVLEAAEAVADSELRAFLIRTASRYLAARAGHQRR
ncbi:MAG: DUF721 domain-containing protein [Acidobacteriota bacterium]